MRLCLFPSATSKASGRPPPVLSRQAQPSCDGRLLLDCNFSPDELTWHPLSAVPSLQARPATPYAALKDKGDAHGERATASKARLSSHFWPTCR